MTPSLFSQVFHLNFMSKLFWGVVKVSVKTLRLQLCSAWTEDVLPEKIKRPVQRRSHSCYSSSGCVLVLERANYGHYGGRQTCALLRHPQPTHSSVTMKGRCLSAGSLTDAFKIALYTVLGSVLGTLISPVGFQGHLVNL